MTNKKTGLTHKTRKYIFATLLLIFPIVLFLVFYVFGYLYSIGIAFSEMDFLGKAKFIGFNRLFDNFKEVFSQFGSDGGLLSISFWNSLKAWGITFVISMPLYYIFSYFIYKKTAGSRVFQTISMLPQIMSALIFSLVFKQVINGPLIDIMGFFGSKDFPNLLADGKYAFGVTMFYSIWSSFGMSVVFYSNAMSGVSPEIIESAQLDGVDNMFEELFYILIPMTFPTFKTMLLIGLTSLFITDYGLMQFYMYGAPPEVWNMGYYYTVKIFNTTSTGYPIVAASGIILTLVSLPIVLTVKHVTDKVDPM